MSGNIGLFCALAVLIVLALRGVNIILASLLASLVIVVTNQLPLADSFNQFYSFGPLGAFTFAGKFFLLFVCGAMFGRVMGESHAAGSIAHTLADKLGADRSLWIAMLTCALLTYGGVTVFVVIFAIYPLGLKLLEKSQIPKRLLLGAIVLGSGTFTLSALPGTPSLQNVIPAAALGTDLFAGAGLGLIATVVMLGAGMWYLEKERIKAAANGEIFIPSEKDKEMEASDTDHELPHWAKSIMPLTLVLLIIMAPRLTTIIVGESIKSSDVVFYQLMTFGASNLVLWSSIALFISCLVTVCLFPAVRSKPLQVLGDGAQDAVVPLINSAAVIGFGGIVTNTPGFSQFADFMLAIDLPPLISMFASVSVGSAIVGSSTGGIQIFMHTLAPAYLDMGIPAEVLHRISAMASGGFDSLPHCGAVVAMLGITGLTHKEAYKDVFVITVAIPVVATLVAMVAAATFYM